VERASTAGPAPASGAVASGAVDSDSLGEHANLDGDVGSTLRAHDDGPFGVVVSDGLPELREVLAVAVAVELGLEGPPSRADAHDLSVLGADLLVVPECGKLRIAPSEVRFGRVGGVVDVRGDADGHLSGRPSDGLRIFQHRVFIRFEGLVE
jgi:hypothetical protein